MDDGPVFEPEPERSIAGRARREGREPDAVLYDALCEQAEQSPEGRLRMLAVYFTGYANGSLAEMHEMLLHPATVMGLSDGGAHCSMMCDASLPTFALVHWVRDRSRGPRIPLERMVAMLSRAPAALYGLGDRGVVAPGLRADLNLIELERLRLELPEIARDLPTGAARVVQRAAGYRATLCAGEPVLRDDRETGARPGRLVRGPRAAA
jgi:N-acyl-D-aspartate/D-glutamate deacylase